MDFKSNLFFLRSMQNNEVLYRYLDPEISNSETVYSVDFERA